ncbi:MAG TPA: MerR family transcriptional regulator [Solirubrobacteraceae bacterium]|nr:MerR family transcriptional regulator [Solirubrobacteraceae bacterium]
MAPSRESDTATAGPGADERSLRIGELAELTGTTPRTIRYWEELGLLGTASAREEGKHRSYTQADVQRVSEIVRLRNLLGLSLEQLSSLLEAESARAHLRRELSQTESPAERRRILEQLLGHISGQLELVQGRLGELRELARELEDKQRLVLRRLEETATEEGRPPPG